MTRLYRFYNIVVGKHGEPFAMCDKCAKNYRPPTTCLMQKIADKTDWECNGHESRARGGA